MPDAQAAPPPEHPTPVEGVTPLALANTFITRYGGNAGIQHLKLQKLVYYCHAWWLSNYDRPFLDERPQVWRHGPVFEELYHSLKGFGWRPITAPQRAVPFEEPPIAQNDEVLQLVDWIWARYGGMTPEELSERTHAPGTPWRQIANQHGYVVARNTTIDDNLIKQCFRGDPHEVLQRQ